MPTLFHSQLQTLSTTNEFFNEKTFLESIDRNKLYALVVSKNVCLTTKKWWEDRCKKLGWTERWSHHI